LWTIECTLGAYSRDWMRSQAHIQAAVLENRSATIWIWLGRYARVLYWATRVQLSRLIHVHPDARL
jgi:hypothetical protein